MPGRGRKDSDSDAGTEDQGTVGTFETLRDEGEHFVHVKQYEKAIESFTKALEMKNDDRTCLVVRAKCHLMLGNSEKALEDANTALNLAEEEEKAKEEKVKDIRALNMKAEALYQKGDFETALVFFHRGNKMRPELQEFRLGIQKCQEAIDNSIGSPSSVKLEATGDLSYFYKDEEKQKQQQKGYTKVNQPQKKEEKRERQRPKDGTNSKTTKELLGQLYKDKEYLEKLFDGLSNSNTQTDDYIKGRACDGLEYLNTRSDFWLQQKPMYARKRDKAAKSGRGSATSVRGDPMKYILIRLEEIDEAQSEKRYQESLKKAEKTLKKVQDMSEESLKNKQDVIANLYSLMGNAYLEMNEYENALEYHQKDLNIARDNDLGEAESRAMDNLGRTYAKMGDYDEAIEVWKNKLPQSKSALESTWLYHEIGRCHLELNQYQEAKDYGERSLAAAKEADDRAWQLHATVLIAQSEVKCDELQAASDSFNQALELAQEQEDHSAQNAIEKALEEVNARIVQGGRQEDEEDQQRDAEDDDQGSHKDRDSPQPQEQQKKEKEPSQEQQSEPQTKESTEDEKNKGKKETSQEADDASVSEKDPHEEEKGDDIDFVTDEQKEEGKNDEQANKSHA